MTVTVVQVCRGLGIEPTRNVTWSIGARVAARYRSVFGREPTKELTPKTSGAGTHCIAVYPDDWQLEIAKIAFKVAGNPADQGALF